MMERGTGLVWRGRMASRSHTLTSASSCWPKLWPTVAALVILQRWHQRELEKIPRSFSPGINEKVMLHQCNDLLYTLRTCYFTTKSTMNTIEFMGMINYSFPEGGLTCSFNNAQMNQFYQLKKREAGVLPVKAAVNKVSLEICAFNRQCHDHIIFTNSGL